MGSFNRKSDIRKSENTDKPFSSNEKFNVTNDPHSSLLTEFWGNNNAHVILTAEADSLPTDANELLNDIGLVGCHPSNGNDLSVHSRTDPSGSIRLFYGNQMFVTEMDMPQSLKSNLARRQKEQSENPRERSAE